jgi:hypothetical protein
MLWYRGGNGISLDEDECSSRQSPDAGDVRLQRALSKKSKKSNKRSKSIVISAAALRAVVRAAIEDTG